MSQEQPKAPAPEAVPLAVEFKKIIPTVFLAILTAFVTSWWNSQKSQSDFQHRIEMLEKRAETNAQNIAINASSLQQNAIRLAEIGVVQNNTLEQIKDLIETRVRPAVAQDGGDIAYKGYKDGRVYLSMHGACQGCPSSAITLKRGIESLIKHYVPEVESVEAV